MMNILEARLSSMLRILLTSNSKIISARILLLFGQYRENLFVKPSYSQQFQNIVQYVMKALLIPVNEVSKEEASTSDSQVPNP